MATRSLGQLTLDLVARISGFKGPLDKASRDADKRFRDMERRAKQFGTIFGAAIATAATAAGVALVKITKDAIDYADQLDELSQRTGVSAEQLSKWGYAAQLSGTDLEGLTRGVTLLSKRLGEAADSDSRIGRLFKALGIEAKDAAGNLRDVEDVLPEIADRFKALDNTTTETALAMELFGKSGAELLEFLNRGSDGIAALGVELSDLGGVIDNETAAAAAEFKDELDRIKQTGVGLGTAIAAQLLPALTKTARDFRELVKEGDLAANTVSVLSGLMSTAVGTINLYNGAVERTAIVFQVLAESAVGAREVIKNIGFGGVFDEGSVAGGFDKIKSAFDRGQQDLDRYLAQQARGPRPDFSNVIGTPSEAGRGDIESRLNRLLANPSGSRGSRGGKSEAEKEAENLQRAYESLMESMHERIELFGKEGEAARVRYQVEFGELSKLTPELQANVIARAEQYDQMVRMEDMQKAADKAREAATKKYQDERDAINELVASLQAEALWLAATTDERYRLEAAQLAGAAATDEDREAIERLLRTRDDMAQMDRGWQDFSSSLADGIFDIASGAKSAEDAIKSFFDTLAKQITNSIAEDWAKSITDMFKGMGQGGSGSGAGGFFSNLLGSLFGGGRANGGQVSAGRFYEVGEADRPEILISKGKQYLIPGNEGTVVPMRGRGGGSITQNFINPRSIDMETEAQKARRRARISQRSTARLS